MIYALNGFILNDPNSVNQCYLDEPIEGLGLPPVRTSAGNYSGRDGGYVSAQFYGMRLITLTGRIFSNDAAELETARRNLAAAVASSTIALTITTNAGNQYLINCYLDSLDMPIIRAASKSPFKISLIAADPTIYDNSSSGGMSAVVNLSTGGGVTWPIVWNPVEWKPGATPTVINNTGDVPLYPRITLTNQMSNPMITNTTTGDFFALNGFTTAAGDLLVIDMYNRTVLLNGGSVLPSVTIASSWWALLPGENSISLTSTNSSDTVVATVSWRSGYRGI
jgi:hypothetical protein